MSLTAQECRALRAAGHHLKPAVTLAAAELSESALAHVRASFSGRPLVKVRVNADSVIECDALARELTQRVPCELVQRIGHVLLLFRRPAVD